MLDTKIPARTSNIVILTIVIVLVLGFFGIVELFALALTPQDERARTLQTFLALLSFPVRQPILMLTQNQILGTILQVWWWIAFWMSFALPALKKASSPIAIGAYCYVLAGIVLYFTVSW